MGLFRSKALALPYASVVFPGMNAVRRGGEFDDPGSLALRRLKPITTKAMIGVPFGPGMGLEEAIAVAKPIKAEHEVNRAATVRLLEEEIGNRAISVDDWDEVLGHNGPTMKKYAVSRDTYAACVDRFGRLKTDGHQIASQAGPAYDAWLEDLDWAVESWVWAAVAYQRLGSAGRVFLFE